MYLDAKCIATALGKAGRRGDGWICCCPAHDDHNPSLSIIDKDEGGVLVHCHAGCDQNVVLSALKEQGLWPTKTTEEKKSRSRSPKKSNIIWTPIIPVPEEAPKPNFYNPKLGKPSLKSEYRDEKNKCLGYMLRFETSDGGKTFRPLTFCENQDGKRAWRHVGFPKPFPLYGLDRLARRPDAPVLITEGEKAADCAEQLLYNMVAVSGPHGAKSVNDVDWTPLVGREVYIWPDADDEGLRAAPKIARNCIEAGAQRVRIISPPANVPKAWDAADALAEDYSEEQISTLISHARIISTDLQPPSTVVIKLAEWRADRYAGPPPERKWLVRDVLPLAVPAMLAAMGGIGKSLTMLKLALEVATGEPRQTEQGCSQSILGGEVCAFGTAVVITAEDDKDEVHRRLDALDPEGLRNRYSEKLMVVPLPNAGGILTLLRGGFECPEVTEEYENLHRQFFAIPDLKLVVFDPMQAFVGADANKDPAAGQYLCTLLGKLAADTGATVMVTHHFRKQGKIKGPSDAREAVRGTTALIDGMRAVFAFWLAETNYARKVCSELGIKYEPNKVVKGAVVKSNWPIDFKVQTYVRDEVGLLCDKTDLLSKSVENLEIQLSHLEDAIGQAAQKGKPYTKTGKNGVYERREELPSDLRKIGRNRLQGMVQNLLEDDRVRQCSVGKSGSVQWLDVPDGLFDRGEGSFEAGALKSRG